MTQQHPITPPPELVHQWRSEWIHNAPGDLDELGFLTQRGAQWGADQELEACLNWLTDRERFPVGHEAIEELKEDRRPKPPSLKEQALEALASAPGPEYPSVMTVLNADQHALIRRALEQLDD